MNFLFRKHSGALVALLPLLLAGCSAALETDGGYSSDSAPTADPSGGQAASVGEYQVQKLRDLIARLIIAYAR